MFGEGNTDRTILTLPLTSADSPIYQSADLGERHRQILSIMEVGREYSSFEVAEKIVLKSSYARQLLKELEDAGYIE